MNVASPSSGAAHLAQRALAVAHDGAAQTRAAAHVLDWLACAAQGATSPAGQAMQRWLLMQASGPVPTLTGRHADAGAAAAYHGALGSALEMDDVHRSAVLHPGPVVLPAVWAACPAHATGAQFLGAVVAGYEVMVQVGRVLGTAHYSHWHPTSTAGSFGAAAAAATALQLGAQAMAQALALAGTQAGGLWQVRHETSLGKAWHTASAARNGLAAAQAAAAGMTGPLAVLEGPSGWLAATAPGAPADVLFETPGQPWIHDVSFKPWPACRHAHPAMDALQMLLHKLKVSSPIKPHDVRAVHVHTYADALRFCDRPTPTDAAAARFSIQHALAAWLCWGEPQLAHYETPALNDTALAELRQRVHVHTCPKIQARYPAHYGARVVLQTNGQTVEAELQDTLGDPARPMDAQARHNKARMLMAAAGWPEARIGAAVAACASLPTARNLQALHSVVLAA
jgi:2-methylcitrate dehydratase PrpD